MSTPITPGSVKSRFSMARESSMAMRPPTSSVVFFIVVLLCPPRRAACRLLRSSSICRGPPYPGPARHECRHSCSITIIGIAECGPHLALFVLGEARVHDNQDGEHDEREERRPLDEETNENEHEPDILG